MKFTPEQEAIIASDAKTIRVNAFAGTGKSCTLIGYARARSRERQLMVAFNKSIQLEASERFPSNVKCRTGHSLAWFPHGAQYANTLQPDLKPFHIADSTTKYTNMMPQDAARVFDYQVIETVKSFLVSADEQIDKTHVALTNSPREKSYYSKETIVEAAKHVWANMQAMKLPMVHDGYLKLYQLSRPHLAYDTIMIDEAQDTNPVLQSILQNQTARLIYVGDSHQAIYSFRGAKNAMQIIEPEASFYLTGSFRFGSKVAETANSILSYKGEKVKLRGLGSESIIRWKTYEDSRGTAYISRTNAAIFQRAYEAVDHGVTVAYIGGIKTYRFEIGEDISKLMRGLSNIRNPLIASFKTYGQFRQYVDDAQDKELSGWIKVVEEYGGKAFDDALKRIRSAAIEYKGPQPNTMVVVTAHRSKGLEFDRVELADNFIDIEEHCGFNDGSDMDQEIAEELNLLYVATTRVKKELSINSSIKGLFKRVPHNNELPALASRGDT